MGSDKGESGKVGERLLAYEAGWRIGLQRAKDEIRRRLAGGALRKSDVDVVVERLEALAASSPLPGRTGASAPREVSGERLQMGYEGADDEEATAMRYFLAGRMVTTADELELLLVKGRWVTGTFGWTGRLDDPPTFSLDLGGDFDWGAVDEEVIAGIETASIPRLSVSLPKEALLRWPPRL